jgi:SAM-dependent methyltransferase
MRDIKINKSYGIILCLCDSINYITDKSDLQKLFLWVFQHLKDGGIFIFDINSSYKLRHVIGNNTFARDDEKLVYIWENYINEQDMVEFYLTFFVKEGDLYRRFDEVHIEKIYENHEIIDTLKKCGFIDVDLCDGFTFNEPTSTSERINFLSVKR